MELKSEKYGVWTIRIKKTELKNAGIFTYEFKIEKQGKDMSYGWVSTPPWENINKESVLQYAKHAILSNNPKIIRQLY